MCSVLVTFSRRYCKFLGRWLSDKAHVLHVEGFKANPQNFQVKRPCSSECGRPSPETLWSAPAFMNSFPPLILFQFSVGMKVKGTFHHLI